MDRKGAELDFEIPPVWPDIKTELREYIEVPENLPIYHIDNTQCYWRREPDVLSLLDFDLAPVGTMLKFDRDPVTGQIRDMNEVEEVPIASAGETARNSMSMSRAPGPASESVRGNTSNIPFWPGGFDEPEMIEDGTLGEIDFEKNLRTLAKGFSAGVEFKSDNCTPREDEGEETEQEDSKEERIELLPDKVNLMSIIHEEEGAFGIWDSVKSVWSQSEAKGKGEKGASDENVPLEDVPEITEDTSIPVLKISEKQTAIAKSEWAEQLDVSVPVTDFEKRIPNPAMTFPYELDTFQKQAILKLEENENVFVAAHTSAGKTTVAEYAIALSQKHMTRVIYTSPIKALSNQKYREFKRKFDSVGLLTGDLQINQTASCLIMTTEILQSMLYYASEVLRDLEFVIFDEVHYINNQERGHVWEETVILLPPTVCIVMLSATVPNPIVFADWVGRTKKSKMYVISTVKRPVPLQHYLYTGTDGKTKDDRFLVVNAQGQFLLDGWYEASKAKDPKGQTAKDQKGQTAKDQKGQTTKSSKDTKWKPPQNMTQMGPKQEQVLWSAFISHLKSNNMLPTVVFMLSRKRCDTSAVLLRNADLTTETEKHAIRMFFQSNIRHLKGADRQLPQVLMMQELLQQGIGIHHSGILPILKEIVEMLFQNGLVKLLFATETFAMGINMPARTVVFDSIKKYDGSNFRYLHPTEYIQMAGRAGRRGHDSTGMVIVLCRFALPHFNELKTIMCGQPQTLESKFKVTYSMVLHLRRLNNTVTVEAMMRRSFKESPATAKLNAYTTELEKVKAEISALPPLNEMEKKLVKFYDVAAEYLECMKHVKPIVFESQKKVVKNLSPGRILIVSYKEHYNKLGLLLSTENSKTGKQYNVLVLKDSEPTKGGEEEPLRIKDTAKWHRFIALTKKEIYIPVGVASSEVLQISAWNIVEITNCQIKVDCSLVQSNWEKRQIPRFKNDPPGQTFEQAVQELMTLSLNASRDRTILEPYTVIPLQYETDAMIERSAELKLQLEDMNCTDVPNFEKQFEVVFLRSELESKRKQLQLKLSDEGLSLYPDYTNSVALLKELGYIDNDEGVALKGRIALQMGSNELLITELILKNVLTALQPAEIAALLSTLIFQQRTDITPTLTPDLQRGCDVIKEIHEELGALEQHYQLSTLLPLHFGLVEVVYDWAQAKSFAEIMEKTDVQEGIIVRCIQQLSETLKDVKNAAITIGDPVLKEKMEEASTAIKRDIVFAASLYTQE